MTCHDMTCHDMAWQSEGRTLDSGAVGGPDAYDYNAARCLDLYIWVTWLTHVLDGALGRAFAPLRARAGTGGATPPEITRCHYLFHADFGVVALRSQVHHFLKTCWPLQHFLIRY